jgi:hypothetical protein
MSESFRSEKNFSFEQIDELLSYDPLTGDLRWKQRRKQIPAGALAGHIHNTGYRNVRIRGERIMAHRIAWMLHYRSWPEMNLDHKNLDKSDNRIENLRLATKAQNQANRRAHKTNKSGFKNVVYREKNLKKWEARIATGKKRRLIGYFDTPEEAHAAYVAEAVRLHGEFARAA